MASSRSGTIALTAAWKASSRELSAGFLVAFGFDVESCDPCWPDDFVTFGDPFCLGAWVGVDGLTGSVASTVSSHGFVFATIMCTCCFDAEGSL